MTATIVRYKLLHPRAQVPTYAHPGDSGADLFAVEACRLRFGEPTYIRFGLAIELPDGLEAQIRPRSSLSRQGIAVDGRVALGTIDAPFRGEIGAIVTLMNKGLSDFNIYVGERVAQLVIAPVIIGTFVIADELASSSRGADGWGSTGR